MKRESSHDVDVSYWKKAFVELPPAIELPCDRPRPAIKQPSHAQLRAKIAAPIAQKLRAHGKTTTTSHGAIALAAYAVFLGKLGATKSFILKLRDEPFTDDVTVSMALRAASMPLLVTLSAEEPFSALAMRLFRAEREGWRHANMKGDAIAEAIGAVADPAHDPLSDVCFGGLQADGDLHVRVVLEEEVPAAFELTYDTNLFTQEAAERLVRAFHVVLRTVADDLDVAVGKIALLDPAETQALVSELSTPAFNWPKHFLLHELFEAKVDQTPSAIAISFGGETITYAELERRANIVAHALASRGIGPDSIVALIQERTPEMIVAILGVLKAGGAYLPIEPDAPLDRMEFLLSDSGAALVLSTSALSARVPNRTPSLFVDRVLDAATGTDGARLLRRTEPDRLAYVIYTSGSTGKPKGVLVEHRNVVHFALAEKEDFGVRGTDALILLSSYTFDASIDQIWLALTSGAKLVIVAKEALLDAHALAKTIAEERVTHIDAVPGLLAGLSPETVPTVKRVVVGGESLPVPLARAWCSAVRLYNEYGPTETTVGSLRHLVDAEDVGGARVPIGRPIGKTCAYVLDWGGCVVPIGVRGELHIGGAGVARGYLGRADLTRERFVRDPFVRGGEASGARMYKTGDVAAWLEGGSLEFVGRADSQVKVRGFRIELGEVEAGMLTHPEVSAAAAVVLGDSPETRRIACYFVAGRVLLRDELRAFLAKTLPAYMIPDVFMALPELPTTVSGKVDKKRLPAPVIEEGPVEQPKNQLEFEVRALFAELLRMPPDLVGVTRSFFELGGQSLLVMQLVSRIRAVLRVTLKAADVLAAPTVREIARELSTREVEKEKIVSRAPVDVGLALPATSVQRRLYVIHQGNPRSTSYNIPLLWEVTGTVTDADLERAFVALIEMHESLRTAFFFQEGQILQKIALKPRFSLQKIDLEGTTIEKATAAFVRPFILEGPPLFRAAAFTENGRIRYVAMDMHHIVTDGTSVDVIMDDLSALLRGETPASAPVRYFDYANWLSSESGKSRLAAARTHWTNLLKDEVPALDLPYDFRRPLSRQQPEGEVTLAIPRDKMDAIAHYARTHEATPFAFFCAIYSIFLSCSSGSAETVFGYPTAGRPHPDFERVVGMFVNTLVFRSRIEPKATFAEYLAEVMAQVRASLRNDEYPFEELVEDLRIVAPPGRNPIFDTMLSYEGLTPNEYACGGATLSERRLAQRIARMDLVLVVRETADGYALRLEYSADLFKPKTVERFARELSSLIDEVLSAEAVLLRDLHTVTPEERQLLVYGFNDTDKALPPVNAVHEIFEEHARTQPDAPAVVMGAAALSYAEVDARANALARDLVARGVVRDSIVGLLLPPCPEMLVSVLAVMKAGGAFMPIDPDYPLSRKAYMLKDSGAKILLTRGAMAEELGAAFSGARIDLADPAVFSGDRTSPKVDVRRGDLAYVIYTSGSTGQPKGTLIEHKSLLNFARWYADEFAIVPTDGVSKYAGFGFDASIAEVVPSFIAGARLVIVPAEIRLSIDELDVYFADRGVTVAFLPTQFGETFLRHADKHRLRAAFLGGEKLRSLPTDRCIIINGYGPTEYTVAATAFKVDKSYDNIPIGKPVYNTQIHVLDRLGRLCPIGVPGELCISGASMGRGYLNQPGLTAEKFVDSPIHPGRRMYRTGDLARLLPDGNLEFLGRIDTQVKVRGFRIELGEIEQGLMAQEGIREATVVARENPRVQGDLALIAFVTRADGTPHGTEEDIKAELGKTLPPYMVPSRIVVLDEIPLTANGKVDKRKLPHVEIETTEVVAPRTDEERSLRKIYADVLGLPEEHVGVTTSFLDLGGHSLKAAVLLSAIYRASGVQLRLAKFLTGSTVAEIAAEIAREAKGDERTVLPRAPEGASLPLTSSQARIFAVHQLAPWSTAYNIPFAWELRTDVDDDTLAAAIAELAVRHHALRASFTLEDGIPRQVFAPGAKLEVARWETDDANLVSRLEHFVQPFDLEVAPLFRAAIIHTESRRVLAIDAHHIIADGLSMRLLLLDLEALIEGTAEEPSGPTFADYVAWEQGESGQKRREEERAHWLEKFRDPPEPLELPYDFDRPPRNSPEGDVLTIDLLPETAGPLAELAKAQNITPIGVYLAAFGVVLSRLGNTPDLVVGVPASGRIARGTEEIVGMFVNTVPVRMTLAADETFSAFAARVGKDALDAFERQAYQLNDLVSDLGVVRDPSRNPLFDVLFSWEDEEIATLPGSALGLVEIPPAKVGCKFDLELTVQSTKSGQRVELLYSTKLFKRPTAERFAAHLRSVLEQAARNAEHRIADFAMLQPWERETLLTDFNRTDVPLPKDLTYHALFERHVRERPDAIFVEDADGSLTFAQADKEANAIARALCDRGVRDDDVVALAMKRTRHLIAALLGVMKSGAGYLPIEPDQPSDRAALMIEDSGAKALLTDGATFGIAADLVVPWEKAVSGDGAPIVPARGRPDSIAYVIYTSGSTGKPKGVVLEHRNVVNFLLSSIEVFQAQKDDGFLLFSSFTFDASVEQMGLAIASGARVVIATKELLLDHEAFEHYVRAHRVTHLDTVPLFLSSLTPKAPLGLRRVIVGGDICPMPVAQRFAPMQAFYNEYGPTETTIASLRHRVRTEDLGLARLPVGRPVANTKIYILDWTKNLAPLGVPGEMYIGGAGVARGYLNNPELTSERFVPNPFAPSGSGERLYRTGDIARWTPEGSIDFLGRADTQVKIRGFRIELGEIEAALIRHPAVAEAAVVVVPRGEDKSLAAYLVLRSEASTNELRSFLLRALPSYMVPDAFMFMTALPVTTSGKVDRRRLPEPVFESATSNDAPATEAEERLLAIWSEVLRRDPAAIPIERSFFELGGHSLLIMLLITRIQQSFGVRLVPADVFDKPTIRGQAALVATRERKAIEPIPRVMDRPYYPLSSVQRRLYAMQQANRESVSYNMPHIFAVEGHVTRERLEEVVRALFARHPSLRTSFELVDGEPVAVVHESVHFSLAVEETDEEIDALMTRLVKRFDLAKAPLVRVWLIKRSDGKELLIVDFHHIIVDGFSTAILWQEISEIIRGQPLPPLRVGYVDFAVWQASAEHQAATLAQGEFWRREFETLPPPLELPFDFRRPALRNHAGDLVIEKTSKETLGKLDRLSHANDATLFITLLTIWFDYLSRIGGTDDVVVGVPTSGRVHPDIQGVVGMFVNTVPWRSHVPTKGSFIDFLAQTKARSIEILSREEYQLETLLDDLGPKAKTPGHNPLFDVMFVYQARESSVIDAGRVKLHFQDFVHHTAKMDLVLIATETDDGLEVAFEYPTELFERKTVERIARGFLTLVENVIADPTRELTSLDVLTPAEKDAITKGFNATEHALPDLAASHRLFEDWVRKTPDAAALVFRDRTWTYAEVNRQANAIAAWLTSQGAGRDDVIGVLCDPCAEMLPAMLGVLKAGAAFLPIDSEYPIGRKVYMLEDSQAKALLVRGKLDEGLEFKGPRLDLEKVETSAAHDANPSPGVHAEDAAYVIYTSGSTGKPKGVVIEHRNLLNFALWYIDYYGIQAGEGVGKYAGFSFDASISEVFPACYGGAKLVVVPEELRLAPKELARYFDQHDVAVAFLPTQFGEQFMRLEGTGSLRIVTLAGEKLRTYRPLPWKIVNGYGPTEYTVCTTAFIVDAQYENIPIGKPVWNTQVLVLDRHGRISPVGVPGELCVAGKSIARGYLRRPELTAEKFVAHPFEPNARLYRTGDLARFLPDGNLEFLGRIDSQVKVRGFRVELGEIEQTLLDSPSVKDAVVVDRKDASGTTYLVGYLVPSAPIDEHALRAHLARNLPEYMVPARFHEMDALPLTPNGKVDKAALPDVERAAPVSLVPAESATEHRLLAIWSRVLSVPQDTVGVTTTFTDLGGHSLKAIALTSEIYKELGVELRVSDVFRHPTVRALGQLLGRAERSDAMPPIDRLPHVGPIAASSVQKRMFLMQEMDRTSVAYNLATLFALGASITEDAVVRALSALVRRHDAFRSSFFLDGDDVKMRTEPPHADAGPPLSLSIVETTEKERDRAVAALVRPFDLTAAPLARAFLVKTERASYLFFDMHHIVSDGGSMSMLVTELNELLRGKSLPASIVSLRDCTAWEATSAYESLLATQREHWRTVFADGAPPPLELLTDFPRPLVVDAAGETIAIDLPESTVKTLRALAKKEGLSLFALTLTAFDVFLARLTRQEEVVLGTPVSGRFHPDMEHVFGMFVNTLVLLQTVDVERSFVELARDVAYRAMDALDHQAFPFGDLVDLLGEKRRTGHSVLFDVMFSHQSVDERVESAESVLMAVPVANDTSKFDLSLSVDESKDGISLAIEYRTSLFSRATIERHLACMAALLADIAERPRAKVKELSILTAEDRALVTDTFNRTARPYPEEAGAHLVFEAAVDRFGDNVALASEVAKYTYREADAAANRLARALVTSGVKKESIVGVFGPPSCELFIAELAVLKAGGAFLPLDHRYPRERIEYTLRDSEAAVLLSTPGFDAEIDWPGKRLALDLAALTQGSPERLNLPADRDGLAYVIYTSGSTGRPKGVAIEHRSLVHFIHRHVDFYSLTEKDRHSKYAGIGFDASIAETFPILSCGGALHIVPEELRLSPPGLAAWSVKHGITIMDLPTQLTEELLSDPTPTNLRWLVVGGDRLRRHQKREFALSNEYGPTEFTVSATAFVVDAQYENIPIGKPISNTQVYILDAGDQPCPPGVPGELCLAGNGVARGYLGNPELTDKKFVQHPLAIGRMYRTGDLARWLPNGNIEFLGRIDSQVKIRGFRIELGEIEKAILDVPGVVSAVVIDRLDAAGDKFLVGYYVAADHVTDLAIRDHLRRRVPEYMIPPALVRIADMPVTTSGKVDKRKLPEPVIVRAAREPQPPSNLAEALIVEALSRSLGRTDFGVDDDFFDFGGNSMKAVSVVAVLAENFKITANDLFRLRTARALAQEIPMQRGDLKTRLTSIAQEIRGAPPPDPLDAPELADDLAKYRARIAAAEALPLGAPATFRNVLLTGATGFLGSHLLDDLLRRTDAKVHVVMRAKNRREAWDRLKARAAYYFGPDALEQHRRRVILVLSDLSQPELGLDPSVFGGLASSVDCVIHSAALTKHYGDRSTFVAANVDATKNLLALARAANAPFHFVSTTSVGLGDIPGKKRALFTELDCDNGQVAPNHYVSTKLDAEKAVVAFREEGRPAAIYRVGYLTADTETRIFQQNADDASFVQELQSYSALGAIPKGGLVHSFCPVNQVSDAILRLFALPALASDTHHIDRTLTPETAERIIEANKTCKAMDDAEFYEMLAARLGEPGVVQAATAVLLHGGILDDDVSTEVVTLKEKTDRVLERIGFAWKEPHPEEVWSLVSKSR